MKKMALMAVSLMVCLYLAGCGSPDRNRQGREQLTAQTQAADMAQAAGMEQESSRQMDGTQLAAEDTAALQEEAQDAQTEWDGQIGRRCQWENILSIQNLQNRKRYHFVMHMLHATCRKNMQNHCRQMI